MPKYRVHLTTVISATVEIDVPDGIAQPDEIADYAYEHGPSLELCAQCSGWGRSWSIDMSGEWETAVHHDGPHKGLAYVTDEDGNEVTGETAEES